MWPWQMVYMAQGPGRRGSWQKFVLVRIKCELVWGIIYILEISHPCINQIHETEGTLCFVLALST